MGGPSKDSSDLAIAPFISDFRSAFSCYFHSLLVAADSAGRLLYPYLVPRFLSFFQVRSVGIMYVGRS